MAVAFVGDLLVRWLESFGRCPAPERDPGPAAWAQLRRRRGPPLLGGPLVDEPHLCVGTTL